MTRSGRVEPRTRATNGTDMPSAGARRPLEAIRSPAAVREPGRLFSCPQKGRYDVVPPHARPGSVFGRALRDSQPVRSPPTSRPDALAGRYGRHGAHL